jgi:hypothetical protein
VERVEKPTGQKEEQKIVLPKEVQEEMLRFFLRTSIPRKKKNEQLRLSNTNDGGET